VNRWCLTVPLLALAPTASAFARPTLPVPTDPVRAVQPVQEYFIPFADVPAAYDYYNQPIGYTHLGTDYGRMGPSAERIHWEKPGAACVDLRGGNWAGMWHSLAGLARERDQYLDFTHCYPACVKDPFQPKCVGLVVKAQGVGTLKIELKSPAEEVLWKQTVPFNDPDHVQVRTFDFPPDTVRSAKLLNWVAEPGAVIGVDQVGPRGRVPADLVRPAGVPGVLREIGPLRHPGRGPGQGPCPVAGRQLRRRSGQRAVRPGNRRRRRARRGRSGGRPENPEEDPPNHCRAAEGRRAAAPLRLEKWRRIPHPPGHGVQHGRYQPVLPRDAAGRDHARRRRHRGGAAQRSPGDRVSEAPRRQRPDRPRGARRTARRWPRPGTTGAARPQWS